jgi:hypothetical protein
MIRSIGRPLWQFVPIQVTIASLIENAQCFVSVIDYVTDRKEQISPKDGSFRTVPTVDTPESCPFYPGFRLGRFRLAEGT